MGLRVGDFLIDDDNWKRTSTAMVQGMRMGRGLEARDYGEFPEEMFAPPSQIIIHPQSEWSDRIKELEERKALVSDVRNRGNFGAMIPSLNQGSNGYCWGHSTAHAVILLRAIMNQPYVPLSAYMVCAIIMKGANRGGWCGLSQEFLRNVGICSQAKWPQGERDYRRLDTPEVRADAALHKVTEEFVDLTRPAHAQSMTWEQCFSLALDGVPFAADFNWWAHSVCVMDPVEVERGSFGLRILNSWSDSWGDKGTGVLRGSRAVPDGAVASLVTHASPN